MIFEPIICNIETLKIAIHSPKPNILKKKMSSNRADNINFETEVRRIAEAVWNLAPGDCQATHYDNDPAITELDGIARLRDVTHLIMVTTSTRLQKVKDDVKKLAAAEKIERIKTPAVSKWIITENQLEGEHIEYARKSNVNVLTLWDFQRRFFNSHSYLSLRNRAVFGSARDPSTDSINIAEDAYVELPIKITYDSNSPNLAILDKKITLDQIVDRLIAGNTVVMRAPFGSGKSLTTREVFRLLAERHRKNSTSPVPLALNLREHWGEDYSDEILERHARSIGYTPKEDLVVAWRAGMCSILFDGFDELSAQSVIRTDNKNFMKEARRRALEGVRNFTSQKPKGVGTFLCGRDHYFDEGIELSNSLGLGGHTFIVVDLEEFTEENATKFLIKNGISDSLPDWLPRKPLILSYLLRTQLFSSILNIDSSKGFGFAWDSFLTKISEREAELQNSSMDPNSIRAVLEKLADGVRSKFSGTGPITGNDLADAYSAETGQAAGEGVLAQLQRLPGLTQRESEAGSRSFVDLDMLGALQGGSFAKQALAGFPEKIPDPLSELSEKAAAMATYIIRKNEGTADTIISIAEQLSRRTQRERISSQIIADCLTIALRVAIESEEEELDCRNLIIDGANLSRIPLDEIRLSGVQFKDCLINEVAFGPLYATKSVVFRNCTINKVCGVTNKNGLPPSVIEEDCEIISFDNMATNSAVLQLDIPAQMKALITVLRKLYKQAGTGRKITALSRGITQPEVLKYIDSIISILQKNNFVSVHNTIVHPVRKQTYRVELILASPTLSKDSIVLEARAL